MHASSPIGYVLLVILMVVAVDNDVAADSKWESSQLSMETIDTVRSTTQKYHQCVDKELNQITLAGKDSRAVTDFVLKKCDYQLKPIQDAFAQENVSPAITKRYLRRKRTQTTRNVLRLVMFTQSSLSGSPTDPMGGGHHIQKEGRNIRPFKLK